MYGAILGDMIGAPYEFNKNNIKTKDFEMFNRKVRYTDDSVMTVAVADAILHTDKDASEEEMKDAFVVSMQKWGKKYPKAGYGGKFKKWLVSESPHPYGSYGNGSAMRVSPVGWYYESLERTIEVAGWSAEVTHNHPDGVLGAKVTAAIIYLARTGASKEEIKSYARQMLGNDLSMTCDEVRPWYKFDVSCLGTVPFSIIAFLEGRDFEDVIRTAVSLGGDCDTLTCIAGSMAEAFYGVPEDFEKECEKRLPEDMREIIGKFYRKIGRKVDHC